MRKVSPFLELVLWRTRRWIIAPVDDCDGHFCHLLDSLPLVMGEQVVGRMSCLPLVRRADHRPCPVSEVCLSCLPLVVPVGVDTGAKPPATLVGVGLQRRLPSSVMSSSLGVTLPCRTLLLYLAWLRQSGTCPPLLQMASSPGARVKWRVECTR